MKPEIPFDCRQSFLEDGINIFRELLRIDTTNPPGNEVVAANRAVEWLQEVGVESKIHDAEPTRRSLVACIGPNDENTLILSAHLDVVPAEPEHWEHPPFAAEIADGCIWGRGAIDMKHMAAYGLTIIRELVRQKIALKRGVKLVLVADEEAGCEKGSLHLARNRPEWLSGSVAITEVGGFTLHVEDQRIYPVQVAEKGFVWLRLHIKGMPGHGSMPHKEGALVKLAEIVNQVAAQPFPFRCTQPVQDFLDGVAKVLPFPKSTVFRGIGREWSSDFVLEKLIKDEGRSRVFKAMVRDTLSPTMASAGTKTNVIPGSAELTVDCRILPGTDPAEFVKEFKQRIKGDYELEILAQGPPLVMDKGHPLMASIETLLKEADPGCHVVPSMITGFTDARAFVELGIPCFGFSPVWLPEDIPFAPMFHGHNERIPVHGFKWGLATLFELVKRECANN